MSANDKNSLGYGTLLNEINNKSETDSEISMSVFEVRSSDEEITPANDRFSKADGYHVVPPPITGNFLTLRADISFAGKTNKVNIKKPKSVYESVVPKPKINRDKVIIEDWNSDDEDDVSAVKTVSPVKTNETQIVRNRVDKIGVLTRIGLVNPVRPNGKRAVHTVSTARPISTARPVSTARLFAPKITQTNSAIRPIYLRMDNVKNMTTVGTRAVVSTSKDKINPESILQDHAVVDSGFSSHMTGNKAYLSNYEDYNGGFVAFGNDPKGGKITGKGKIRTANLDFDDVYFVDELNFKLPNESQVVLRAPRQNGVYSLDLKNIVPSGGLENQLKHKVKIIRCDHGTEFKNHAMNELCAKKRIKRKFSVARTPQQNGVAERKNRTLFKTTRTMLAASLLPIPFWADAVNTACYVLNRVLVTKPQNNTPYELLIGKPPSISFMRPFGCPLTILNTLDPLGKFDGKSDEGYLLGYSTTSKAFRVYNKRTKRVEENMHIDFLEDQPNVAGSGPDWMFDLDFLTNTMNYIPVSVENQVNVDAGTQEHYVAGSSEKDKEPTQEYILLPLHPHRPRISVEDVVQAAQEKPSENSPKDNDVQDSEDVAEKEEQHTLTEAEQALKDDLERMIAQEIAAKAIDDATRQAFEEEKKRAAQATSINKLNTGRPSVSTSNSPLVSTANTPYASAASTPTGANTGGSSFVYLGGQIPIDASTLPGDGVEEQVFR
ncbi:ribonuclease H-like domain-containing protein [Tanacetum coccineum]